MARDPLMNLPGESRLTAGVTMAAGGGGPLVPSHGPQKSAQIACPPDTLTTCPVSHRTCPRG